MSEPATEPKRPVSDKQLAANRANALKSTGPRDTSSTRFNACTHGLRAEHAVLPGESEEAFQARMEKWMSEWNPEGDRQRFLVERAVIASWRMDRAVAVEEAMYLR